MASYQLITSARLTAPDMPALLLALRAAIAPEVGIVPIDAQHYRLKKSAPWTPAEVTTAQDTIDGAAAQTPQLDAQHDIDDWPIAVKALALTVLDEVNVLRAAASLAPRTPAQLINAVRAKAAQL